MKTTTTLAAAALAAAMAIGGCQSNHQKGGHHDDDDDAGDATEVRMNAGDVPANVRQAFDHQFPQSRVREVSKETYPDGTVHYEYEFVNKDGKAMEVEFDQSGRRLPEH